MRSQGFRRIIYVDAEITKNYIKDGAVEGKRVNQMLKSSKDKEEWPGGEQMPMTTL